MSFSTQVKSEICKKSLSKPCCTRAACYGFACFGKYYDFKGYVLHTEQAIIAEHAQKLFKQIGVHGNVIELTRTYGVLYEFAIKEQEEIQKMLFAFENSSDNSINKDIFICPACYSAFVSAAFLSCGIVIDPKKEYSVEFVLGKRDMLCSLKNIFEDMGFDAKIANRRYNDALYFKTSEQVEDILTYMGATSSSIEVMNSKIYKEIRNKTNRITNCENANIDKIINASENAIGNLKLLRANHCFESLPEELRDIAKLRIDYPEYSLLEIGQMLEPPLGKSGVSHRLRKLAALAQEYKKEKIDD